MNRGEKGFLNDRENDLWAKSDVTTSCKLEMKKMRLSIHPFFLCITDLKHTLTD